MSKLLSVCLAFLLCFTCLAGCNAEFTPEVPEGISNPEGGVVSAKPPMVEGWIVKISKDKVTLMVDGVEWDMKLDEQVQKNVKRFKEIDMPMKRGGYVLAQYELLEDGTRLVNRLEHLNMN